MRHGNVVLEDDPYLKSFSEPRAAWFTSLGVHFDSFTSQFWSLFVTTPGPFLTFFRSVVPFLQFLGSGREP